MVVPAITWHVKDLKILHVHADEVTKAIDCMKVIYGSHMKESRMKKHNYLGMDLALLIDVEVSVTITDYLKNIVSDFPDTI